MQIYAETDPTFTVTMSPVNSDMNDYYTNADMSGWTLEQARDFAKDNGQPLSLLRADGTIAIRVTDTGDYTFFC